MRSSSFPIFRSSVSVRALLLAAIVALAAGLVVGCGKSGSKTAQLRLLNVSTGYSPLDLYTNLNNDSSDSDAQQQSSIAYESIGSYATVKSDSYSVKIRRTGIASTLYSLDSENLSDESHATYVAYGTSGHPAMQKIDDDQTDPDANKSKVSFINTASAGDLDIYLTEESVDLNDASPTLSSSTASTTIDSSTYRLRVTGASNKADIRLDVSGVSFDSKQVVTLILTATPGGVLVNALFLPQQGSLTKYLNTKSRVRGAVGVANGTQVSIAIGGTTVLFNAAVGVIGNDYKLIESGTVAINVAVDGVSTAVASQALTAGADYTLLVWSDDSGTRTTLISDDNRRPTSSGKAKIRLLNGMSGLGEPVTLAIDFAPIAEAVALGQASAPVEVDSGSDYQLDASNSTTAANLITKTSVSVQSPFVYTLFVSGNAATPGSTLRKDVDN